MRSEWTKFWSVRSTWWCLVGAGALMGMAALTLGADSATGGRHFAATQPVIDAAVVFSFGIAALAMLTVTAEYASGGIRATLQAVPRRGRLLAAKAVVVAAVVAVATALGGLVTAVTVWAFLRLDPFDGAAGLPVAEVATDLLKLGCFGAMIALLSVGVSFALRSSAGTLTVVFLLLAGIPLVLAMTGDQVLIEASLRTPLFAGLSFMGSANNPAGEQLAYPAGEGFAWLAGWTLAALAIGYAVLRRRDA
ncbi:hypothetical protein AB0M54_10240 [Actinoplanes sp. NPDC051470]|uniref:hypothetical protein n=1 Tax=unclassified Actinoplanes TaxID=2626549 RepID=UPI00343F6488